MAAWHAPCWRISASKITTAPPIATSNKAWSMSSAATPLRVTADGFHSSRKKSGRDDPAASRNTPRCSPKASSGGDAIVDRSALGLCLGTRLLGLHALCFLLGRQVAERLQLGALLLGGTRLLGLYPLCLLL